MNGLLFALSIVSSSLTLSKFKMDSGFEFPFAFALEGDFFLALDADFIWALLLEKVSVQTVL